jgi:hypothetical protein
MRNDLHNNVYPKTLFPPVAAQNNSDTARVSNIIDTAGFDSVEFVLINGTNTDANATFAVLVEDGDDSDLVDDGAAVDDAYLLGTEALAGFTFANDGICRKIGYIGNKRYVRVTVTPTGNNSGDWFMAGVALLGHPRTAPTANPPT